MPKKMGASDPAEVRTVRAIQENQIQQVRMPYFRHLLKLRGSRGEELDEYREPSQVRSACVQHYIIWSAISAAYLGTGIFLISPSSLISWTFPSIAVRWVV